MSDAVQFGDVYEGHLDAQGLDDLLSDLELAARVTEVRVKGGPSLHSDQSGDSLQDLRERLHARTVVAAQVHYEHGGTAWVDTLLVGASPLAGYRLVRARLPRSL